jgi:hypothetical protein
VPATLVAIASVSIVAVAIVFIPIAAIVAAISAIVSLICYPLCCLKKKEKTEKMAPKVLIDSIDKD